MRRFHWSRKAAFSLVEVLVATGIITFVVASTTVLILNANDTSTFETARANAQEEIERLASDIHKWYVKHRQDEMLEMPSPCKKLFFNYLRFPDATFPNVDVGECMYVANPNIIAKYTHLGSTPPRHPTNPRVNRKLVLEQKKPTGETMRVEFETVCTEEADAGTSYLAHKYAWEEMLNNMNVNGCGLTTGVQQCAGTRMRTRSIAVLKKQWDDWDDSNDWLGDNIYAGADPDVITCLPKDVFVYDVGQKNCKPRSNIPAIREKTLAFMLCAWSEDTISGNDLQLRIWAAYPMLSKATTIDNLTWGGQPAQTMHINAKDYRFHR